MAAAAALFLIWNIWLTVRISQPRQENQDFPASDPEGVTVVNNTIEGYTTDLTETAANTMPKLVSVSVVEEQSEMIYSGVIYTVMGTDTWILTTSKAAGKDGTVYVRFDNGLTCEGELHGSDPLNGLALIVTHPEFAAEPIEIGSSSALKQGEYVLAMGGRNLHTQTGDISFGIASDCGQRYRTETEGGTEWITETIFTDAVVTPQMEGGVLVNLSGQLVGILSGSASGEHAGLYAATGTSDIVQAAEQMRRSGAAERGYMGVVTKDIKELELYQKSAMNLQLDLNSGLVIMEVIEGSPAQEAGLQANDVLQSADDVLLSTTDSLRKILYSHKPEDTLNFSVIRGGTTDTVPVILR